LISRAGLMTGMQCNDGHLPIAPILCSPLVHSGIRMHEKGVVRLDKVPFPLQAGPDCLERAEPEPVL
jgi:hypothetical protein